MAQYDDDDAFENGVLRDHARYHVRMHMRDGQSPMITDGTGVVHLRRVWWPAKSARLPPFFGKGLRVFAAALEAGPVCGGKRGWLVKKEQLGVGTAPDLASSALKLSTQQIYCRGPTTRCQRLCVCVKTPAAVAHEQATGREGA